MKKKILAGILAIALTTGAVAVPNNENTFLSVNAANSIGVSISYEYNDFEYRIDYDTNTAMVTAYKGTGTYVKFPSVIGKYKVSKIGYESYVMSDDAKSTVKKVYIPDGVKCVMDYAFADCTALEAVRLPKTLNMIGTKAFYNCSALKKISLPGNIYAIEREAFACCSSLQSINLPNKLAKIGDGAFSDCSSLKSLVFPSSLKYIPNGCCASCHELESVTIGKGVTQIEQDVFYCCFNLKKISIPSTVRIISENAFAKCFSLTSISLPASITHISDHTFYFCKKLKSINIPKNVEFIGNYAFCECSSLTNVNLPANIKYIGYNAFLECENLKSVAIPFGIKCISNKAFSYLNKTDDGNRVNNFTIKGYNGTAAQTYANENGIRFINLQRSISKAKLTLNTNGLVTVKYGNTILKKNINYTITGKHNTKTGKYTVTVKGKGLYKGTVSKTFTVKPSTQKITKVIKLKNAVKVYYRKNPYATGYKIQLASNKKFVKARTYKLSRKYFAKTIKNLKPRKIYYVRVQSYRIIGKTVYYGNWSTFKAVATK